MSPIRKSHICNCPHINSQYTTQKLIMHSTFQFALIFVALAGVINGISVRKIIQTDKVPISTLPINQAVQVDNMLYVSGTLGSTPGAGLAEGIVNQTRQTLDNIGYILEEAGSCFRNVVKVTVLLSDMANYDAMNVVYAQYFTEKYPARFAYQVARLPVDALVEIDALAIVGEVVDAE